MRILHLHKYLYTGGIEAIICSLANEMSKSHDVTVCTVYPSNNGDLFRRSLSDAIHVETIGKTDSRPPIKELFKINRYIRRGNFDIVQLHGYFFYYVLAVLFLHNKTKLFYTVHNDAYMENSAWDKRLFWLKRFCFKHNWIRPITISVESQNSFRRLYGCASQLITNGISTPVVNMESDCLAQFRISDNTRVFVHAGRVCEQKNQVMLCRVFQRLVSEGNDVALVIAGPNHRPDIMESISHFLSDRIHYIGESHEVPSMLYHADGMCLSSTYEGLPVVLLESLAVGCIPICTPVGGIVNVLNKENGVLAASVDENDYYEAVKRVLDMDRESLSLMKQKCISSFENYGINKTAQQYVGYYIKS